MCRLYQPGWAALQKLVNTIADMAGRTPVHREAFDFELLVIGIRSAKVDLRARMNANE